MSTGFDVRPVSRGAHGEGMRAPSVANTAIRPKREFTNLFAFGNKLAAKNGDAMDRVFSGPILTKSMGSQTRLWEAGFLFSLSKIEDFYDCTSAFRVFSFIPT